MHQNSCPARLAAERVMLCTTKKFVKSISTRIKCCEDGISQPIKWEIFSMLPITFPLLKWRFESTWPHSAMGNRKIPRSRCCTLHAGHSALIKQCTETFLYMYIFFLEILMCIFLDKIYYPGDCFQLFAMAWQFEMVENRSGNWTKCYDWSAGLKSKHWFALSQPTPQTRKRHKCNRLLLHLMPTRMHRIKNKPFFFSGEGGNIVIWSWA